MSCCGLESQKQHSVLSTSADHPYACFANDKCYNIDAYGIGCTFKGKQHIFTPIHHRNKHRSHADSCCCGKIHSLPGFGVQHCCQPVSLFHKFLSAPYLKLKKDKPIAKKNKNKPDQPKSDKAIQVKTQNQQTFIHVPPSTVVKRPVRIIDEFSVIRQSPLCFKSIVSSSPLTPSVTASFEPPQCAAQHSQPLCPQIKTRISNSRRRSTIFPWIPEGRTQEKKETIATSQQEGLQQAIQDNLTSGFCC